MRYLPHTEEEIREMLAVAGLECIDDLFKTIPEEARFRGELNVPPALGEARLMRHVSDIGDKNKASRMLSFLGCGAYHHHVPPAVDQLLLRSEFYTAYTPYQPEVAQGTLQAIWEFQTLVSELYGLPLANASLYDGASATAEAALMARRLTKRDGIVISGCVHPHYRETTQAYLAGSHPEAVSLVEMNAHGCADVAALLTQVTEDTACIIVGYPSYVGPLADLKDLADQCHARGALLVVAVVEPYALSVATPPGHWGADIVVGEGQPIACPPQYGGPGVGLFACRQERKYLQQLPGRVCGETVDQDGKQGFVLTLSTREQHIRRERATSNICTNQGLLALAFTIRASLLGKSGFVEVGKQCLAKAHYLRSELLKLEGLEAAFEETSFFNEFAIKVSGGAGAGAKLLAHLETQGILGGIDLGQFDAKLNDTILVAVTEQHTREDLDRLVQSIKAR
jgi:glycine dehydrogenase subunit 1